MGAIAQNWTIVLWSAVAGICAVLAAVNYLVWLRKREASGNGIFAVMAASTAILAMCELVMMRSESSSDYVEILRWSQLPVFLLVVTVICFVRVYLRAGRLWLAVVACSLRGVSLLLNFLLPQGLHFKHVTALEQVPFLGGTAAVAIGERNPWMALAQLSLLVLIIFVFDASLTVWKRGERRRAIVAGGAILGFVLLGMLQAVVSFWGLWEIPLTPSAFFSGMIVVMGFELSRDIFRAEQLATEVREGERHLALAATAANLGIWTRNHKSGEVWASPEWRKLFGFAESESIFIENFLLRVHPEDRRLIEETLLISESARSSYELEYRIIRPDGQQRWIASRGTFDLDGKGRSHSACGVSMDVTSRKEAEQALQEQRNELTHLSRVTMLGELSGSLAHELNQPLTAILSNAQAAQRFITHPQIDREELGEILHDIVEADKRAGEVIRSLRALFKKGATNRQSAKLNSIITDVLKLVRSDALNHRVLVKTELDQQEPVVTADPIQLQQVLLNLILNALDAMACTPETDRQLLVFSRLLGDGSSLVSVRDHGPGIADDLHEKIFEPFFTTKTQGLGLGLGVCCSILDAHHSKLQVRNAVGGGAEFSFIMPAEGAVV